MATLAELRAYILALPETTEGTHFRMPAFRVSDKPFISVEKDNSHALLRLDEQLIHTLVEEDPTTYEEVWQSKKYLIGIRLELGKVPPEKLQCIVKQSWRTMAPKKLIRAFDESLTIK